MVVISHHQVTDGRWETRRTNFPSFHHHRLHGTLHVAHVVACGLCHLEAAGQGIASRYAPAFLHGKNTAPRHLGTAVLNPERLPIALAHKFLFGRPAGGGAQCRALEFGLPPSIRGKQDHIALPTAMQAPTGTKEQGTSPLSLSESMESDTSAGQGQAVLPSSASQALQVVELLAMIINHFGCTDCLRPFDPKLPCPRPLCTSMRRCQLLPLTKVNKAFFHAAISVLWEEMDSIMPFLSILGLVGHSENLRDGVSSESWRRFGIYARHTKLLRLETYDVSMFHCWALYIAMSPSRPRILFPSLVCIRLGYDSTISLVIALSELPALQRVHIRFDLGDEASQLHATAALTAHLSQHAKRVASMTVVHPVDAAIVRNLSTMASLRDLTLCIRTGGTAQLLPLVQLPLVSLYLDISPSDIDVLTPSAATNFRKSCAKNSIPTLRTLTILGDGSSHLLAVSIFRATNLTNLTVVARYHSESVHTSAIALFILSAHLERNMELATLAVSGVIYEPRVQQRETQFLPDSTPASVTEVVAKFVTHLSVSKSLRRIDITGVFLPTSDFAIRMVQAIPSLPSLESWRFTPRHATTRPNMWSAPSFEDLGEISRNNHLLTALSTPIHSGGTVPFALPTFAQHQLQSLTLDFHPPVYGTLSPETLAGTASYLHSLFPNLTSLNSERDPSSPQFLTWKYVEASIFSLKSVRERTLAEIGQCCGSGQ
ncbi:hypothetical protein NMY22_g14665 [Coprinellus aureogranulatus]|nr:hypothetical protein NMY22_g14665 [Coprinellus aureogranulatus]